MSFNILYFLECMDGEKLNVEYIIKGENLDIRVCISVNGIINSHNIECYFEVVLGCGFAKKLSLTYDGDEVDFDRSNEDKYIIAAIRKLVKKSKPSGKLMMERITEKLVSDNGFRFVENSDDYIIVEGEVNGHGIRIKCTIYLN